MSRKRSGRRSQARTLNWLSHDLFKRAVAEAKKPLEEALKLCLKEIEQYHSFEFPHCRGGCSAHEAMDAARKALNLK